MSCQKLGLNQPKSNMTFKKGADPNTNNRPKCGSHPTKQTTLGESMNDMATFYPFVGSESLCALEMH